MDNAPSLRETLESAITESQEPVEAPEAPAAEPAPEPVEAAPAPDTRTAAERARDEKGRFAPASEKPEAKPAAAPQGAKKTGQVQPVAASQAKAGGEAPASPPVAPPAPAVPEAPKVKPPQSWKPEVRDLAAKLPAEFHPILAEADRRERETTRVLNETAQVRQFATQVQHSLGPYQSIAAANGQDVMAWAGTALQTVAALYAGTPQQKASVLAQAIALSGVDVEAINQAMQSPQPAARQVPPAPVDMRAEFRKFAEEEAARISSERAQSEVTTWLATPREGIEELWPQMAAMLSATEKAGGKMTLDEAYDAARWAHPKHRASLIAQQAAEAARANAPTVQRAKVAASSVKASPVEPVTRSKGPRSLREDIEAAVAAQRT